MTKREMFNLIASVNADNADIVAFCEHEIELLNSRKGGKRGMTKVQKENEEIKAIIANDLVFIGHPVTVTELNRTGEGLANYTPQKISALLRQMVETGKVIKTIEKKKSYFSIAPMV